MTLKFSYDFIADVYATDMGQSMPFDDAAWYRALCGERGGAALELGCGTGRILIELLASGIDASGVDRSLPMLRRLRKDAAARGITPRLAQMDLRALALSGHFRVILLPYSLITYLTDRDVAAGVLARLSALLDRDGCIAVDTFLPQPVTSFSDFRLDYRRAHGDGTLERHKRIAALADGCNHIERRYRVFGHDGELREEFTTAETIRPYAPAALATLAASAGLKVDKWIFDYSTREHADGARFVTALLQR
jgi:SAM-dependent methyltransferase